MQDTKVKKYNKGITLVALVITIIVLLILAGIGIGAIAGEDGLIAKARQAAEDYEQAAREEANAINEIFEMANGGTGDGDEEPEQPVIDAEGNVQFKYTPSTPTRGNVTVEITTGTGYQIQYRKGTSGNFSRYTGAFTVEENTVINVKLANSSGVTGGVATGNVQNIDKVAPNTFTPTIGTITENSIVVNASTIDTGSAGCASSNIGIKEYRYYANGELKHTGTEESVTITGLTEGTEYSIYVIAEDKAGNSTTSSVITAETTTPKPITSTEIANNPEEYYGAYVDYTPQNGAPVGWRIFYADSENIYLIADDYVPNTYAPNASNGTVPTKSGEYKINFTNILNSYNGTVDIKGNGTTEYPGEDERVKKWINHINSYTSTYENMKATAYLLDTEIWNKFEDANDKVEYVIGGPRLELFVASFNDTHEEKINFKVTDEEGYEIKMEMDSSYKADLSFMSLMGDIDNLYFVDTECIKAYSYWISSPACYKSGQDGYYLFTCNGYYHLGTDDSVYYSGCAFRPIICLKSEIQLVEQNGKYIIQ